MLNDKIKSAVLHAEYSPATYRTKDGTAYFKFRYVELDGVFEIDILEQPEYAGRIEDSVTSHRKLSVRGGQKISINDSEAPRDIQKAKKISIEWAELTHFYVKTGKTIDDQVLEYS